MKRVLAVGVDALQGLIPANRAHERRSELSDLELQIPSEGLSFRKELGGILVDQKTYDADKEQFLEIEFLIKQENQGEFVGEYSQINGGAVGFENKITIL